MSKQYLPRGIHTANMPLSPRDIPARRAPSVRPFITIAQQVGAECDSLPRRLAQVLSAADRQTPPWSHWDQELIEKVSAGRHIPAELIRSLETSGHSWLDDLLTGISGRTDEMVVFHGIKDVVRDLASAGRAILVGHGSVYITGALPGGLHVRLIAPLELRVQNAAKRLNLSPDEAARHMHRLDRQRAAFFHRFWPDRPLAPELFAAVLNVAELDEERLTKAVVAMLPDGDQA